MKKSMGIVGYGNQAKAWAANLRDSGWSVTVLLREESKSKALAIGDGFDVEPLDCLGKHANLAMLLPDDAQPDFFQANESYFQPGQNLIFAHGYSLHFQTVKWPSFCHHMLLAPKAIGIEVRRLYQQNKTFPAVLQLFHFAKQSSETQSQKQEELGQMAKALGAAPLVWATAKDEVVSDLLSEQVLLCGLIPAIVEATYDMLVKAGINPDVAYLECVHEMGIFQKLFEKQGFAKSLVPISPTARFGARQAAELLESTGLKDKLEGLLSQIQDGRFSEALVASKKEGFQKDIEWTDAIADWSLEKLGHDMRKKMS